MKLPQQVEDAIDIRIGLPDPDVHLALHQSVKAVGGLEVGSSELDRIHGEENPGHRPVDPLRQVMHGLRQLRKEKIFRPPGVNLALGADRPKIDADDQTARCALEQVRRALTLGLRQAVQDAAGGQIVERGVAPGRDGKPAGDRMLLLLWSCAWRYWLLV